MGGLSNSRGNSRKFAPVKNSRGNSQESAPVKMCIRDSAYSEHYILTLGSRDVGSLEEFMAKLPGDEKQKLAQVREAYSYMMVHPGCKMMAPGAAIPEELGKCIQALNTLYKSSPALYQMCIRDRWKRWLHS